MTFKQDAHYVECSVVHEDISWCSNKQVSLFIYKVPLIMEILTHLCFCRLSGTQIILPTHPIILLSPWWSFLWPPSSSGWFSASLPLWNLATFCHSSNPLAFALIRGTVISLHVLPLHNVLSVFLKFVCITFKRLYINLRFFCLMGKGAYCIFPNLMLSWFIYPWQGLGKLVWVGIRAQFCEI